MNCHSCNARLSVGVNFTKSRSDKRDYICNPCASNRTVRWRKAHPDCDTKWYSANPQKFRKKARDYRKKNPDRVRATERRRREKLHRAYTKILGGKCIKCGETNWRVLQVNHLYGNGAKEYAEYRSPDSFYRAIIHGIRPTHGIDLRCANCQRLYEYERNAGLGVNKYRLKALTILGGKCVDCGSADPRVLAINHKYGGGVKEGKRLGSRGIYVKIIKHPEYRTDYDVRCANHNILYTAIPRCEAD